MKRIVVYLVIFSVTSFGFGQNVSDFFKKSDAFFKQYVSKGLVDYKTIASNSTELNGLMDLAAQVTISAKDPKVYQSFYINAYNLSVIKGIIEKYPVDSPLKIKGFFDQKKYVLAGAKTTLNDLENKLLRANFPSEARFHFVLVCAGLGCPPIIAEAYTPDMLEEQLQRQTVKALNNPDFIKVGGKKVQISQIFEWYKGDFTKKGSEVDYINRFREEPIPAKAKVSYYPYNWKLNSL